MKNNAKVGEFFYTSFLLSKLKKTGCIDKKAPTKVLIKYEDIIWISTKNLPKNWISLNTKNKTGYKEISLDSMLKEINREELVKVNSGTAINIFYIDGIDVNNVFIGNVAYSLTRTYKVKVFKLLENLVRTKINVKSPE